MATRRRTGAAAAAALTTGVVGAAVAAVAEDGRARELIELDHALARSRAADAVVAERERETRAAERRATALAVLRSGDLAAAPEAALSAVREAVERDVASLAPEAVVTLREILDGTATRTATRTAGAKLRLAAVQIVLDRVLGRPMERSQSLSVVAGAPAAAPEGPTIADVRREALAGIDRLHASLASQRGVVPSAGATTDVAGATTDVLNESAEPRDDDGSDDDE